MPPTDYSADSGAAIADQEAAAGFDRAMRAPTPVQMPGDDEVVQIPLADIRPSPSNPRKVYSQAGMAELTDSVRAVGVLQPVLVRPSSTQLHGWELVFGHRRLRAAQAAGLETVPAMVRKLSYEQAAQMQAVENLQREDLTAIEEAQGYAAYIAAHGVSKDELAQRIGKSRTHVYNRLKLAELDDTVAQALIDGRIQTEVATLIARVPPRHHAAALRHVLENAGHHAYGVPSFRKARSLLAERYTLDLADAMFDTSDALLLPLAGACTTCPKRSGNCRELYADLIDDEKGKGSYAEYTMRKGSADVCTDPDCFDQKKKAHLANAAAALQAEGHKVVTGSAARAAVDAHGTVKGDYIALKDARPLLAKVKAAAKAAAKAGTPAPAEPQTVLIQDPRTGKTHQAVKAAELRQAAGVKEEPKATPNTRREDSWREEAAKREAKSKEYTAINEALFAKVRAAAAERERTAWELRLVAQVTWEGVSYNDKPKLAQLHGFSSAHQVAGKLNEMPLEKLSQFLLDCALIADVEALHGLDKPHQYPEQLLQAASEYGIEVGT